MIGRGWITRRRWWMTILITLCGIDIWLMICYNLMMILWSWIGLNILRLRTGELGGGVRPLETQASVTGAGELLLQRHEVVRLCVDDRRGVSVDDDGRPVLHLRQRQRRLPDAMGVLAHLQTACARIHLCILANPKGEAAAAAAHHCRWVCLKSCHTFVIIGSELRTTADG